MKRITSTSGLDVFQRSIRNEIPQIVDELRGLLGAQLVAYLGNVQETRAVRLWAEGVRTPSTATEQRLRLALQVASVLTERDHPRVAQSWFQGMNPQLDDESPARLIRTGELDKVGPRVLVAARSFTTGSQ